MKGKILSTAVAVFRDERVKQQSKDVTQTQQQRSESPVVTMYLCDVFCSLINSCVC